MFTEKRHIEPLWRTPSVPLLLIALASQLLAARFSSGSFFGSDLYTMQNVLHWECSTAIETFLPPVRCLGSVIEMIFEYPAMYLLAIVLLKVVTFLFLYLIFVELDRRDHVFPFQHVVPMCALVFLIVVIRQLHLGQDILLRTDLHTRMWGQILILFALLLFIRKQYLGASLTLGAAVFLQAVNALNVFLALATSVILKHLPKIGFRQFAFLTAPFLGALTIQYLAAYGIPDISRSNPAETATVTEAVTTGGASTEKPLGVTVTNWYEFVFAQDRDDLSLLYLFSSELGIAYIAFQLTWMGLLLFLLYYDLRRWHFLKETLLICSGVYLLLIVATLIEHFQWPQILLQAQIVIQPRRLLYLPLVFLSFVSAKVTVNALFSTTRCNNLEFSCVVGAIIITFGLIEFGSSLDWKFSERYPQLAFYSLAVTSLLLTRYVRDLSKYATIVFRLIPTLAVLLVLAKGLVHATPPTLDKLDKFFGTTESRDFTGYLLMRDDLSSGQTRMTDLLSASDWFNTLPNLNLNILTVGFEEDWEMIFQALNRRLDHSVIVSSNVYRYRGAMHYDFATYKSQIEYFENLLGVKAAEMWREDGTTQIGAAMDWASTLDDGQLSNLKSPSGTRFDLAFAAFRLSTSWSLIYSNSYFFAYLNPESTKM